MAPRLRCHRGGGVLSWGCNGRGQLGDGTVQDRPRAGAGPGTPELTAARDPFRHAPRRRTTRPVPGGDRRSPRPGAPGAPNRSERGRPPRTASSSRFRAGWIVRWRSSQRDAMLRHDESFSQIGGPVRAR
ncbi:RCC1-like domain-containing protein [Micromonospora sp.]|uniref:RCC1-like domain-containing protein n=1 Tax=Micromonospora sp. TaxID=1876 RepID=UPI003B3A2D2E